MRGSANADPSERRGGQFVSKTQDHRKPPTDSPEEPNFLSSHSLGGVNPRLHHGTLNAMFLPAVVRFNAAAPSIQAAQWL